MYLTVSNLPRPLLLTPWSPASIDDTRWFIKCVPLKGDGSEDLGNELESDPAYACMVTDGTHIWACSVDVGAYRDEKEKFQDALLVTREQVVALMREAFAEGVVTCSKFQGDTASELDGHVLELTYTMHKVFKFYWELTIFPLSATLADNERLCRELFVQPMLRIGYERALQVQELYKIIAAKDAEISQYQAQGASLGRATRPFNRTEFIASVVTGEQFGKRTSTTMIEGTSSNPTLNRDSAVLFKACLPEFHSQGASLTSTLDSSMTTQSLLEAIGQRSLDPTVSTAAIASGATLSEPTADDTPEEEEEVDSEAERLAEEEREKQRREEIAKKRERGAEKKKEKAKKKRLKLV